MSARADLCGGRSAMIGPTATSPTGDGPLDFGSIVNVSRHYRPITAILYTSRMITVAIAIQAERV